MSTQNYWSFFLPGLCRYNVVLMICFCTEIEIKDVANLLVPAVLEHKDCGVQWTEKYEWLREWFWKLELISKTESSWKNTKCSPLLLSALAPIEEKVVRAKKKVNPRSYGDRIGRGGPEQKLKIVRGDGTEANGLGAEAQEGGKEIRGQGQKYFVWSGNMRKLKQCQKSLSPLENLEFSSVALNFWTSLLRDPGTERVQKRTASETLNNSQQNKSE